MIVGPRSPPNQYPYPAPCGFGWVLGYCFGACLALLGHLCLAPLWVWVGAGLLL